MRSDFRSPAITLGLVSVFAAGCAIVLVYVSRDPDPLRTTIDRVRDRWRRGGFGDAEVMVRRELGRYAVHGIHMIEHYDLGDHLESEDGEDYLMFKPAGRFGGRRNILTPEIVEALNFSEGIVFMNVSRWGVPGAGHKLLPRGSCVLFTLPGKSGWKSAVAVRFGSGIPGWSSFELDEPR